jgi:two-component system KDP operon response regulator KdpE
VTRVLAVDDEAPLRRALSVNLRARGYEVDVAPSGEVALELSARHPPDLVVLDLGLPDMSGFEVIRHLRSWTEIPIIVLSARDAQEDKVTALDAGADDYITKPFGMEELVARLRAVLRRKVVRSDRIIECPDFTIDFGARLVSSPCGDVRLTATEWRIVECLATRVGALVSGRELKDFVWGPRATDKDASLRVHLGHIRRKLEPDPSLPRYFVTEVGVGYRLQNVT